MHDIRCSATAAGNKVCRLLRRFARLIAAALRGTTRAVRCAFQVLCGVQGLSQWDAAHREECQRLPHCNGRGLAFSDSGWRGKLCRDSEPLRSRARAATTTLYKTPKTAAETLSRCRSAWKKRFRAFAGRYADSPLFRRLSSVSNTAAAKSRDAAEDLRERWETSNSPFVHRIQVCNSQSLSASCR